ncbi:NADAR family protein [Microbulbifer sp. VTAC004]|uniref:NADAR family protein n=1 Tax=unclassified Microbulbifer TaxID=2619833 RepID=UPI0040399B6E
MRETEKFYFFWKHQFGQWTLRDISDIDGQTYNCCEQYMMYKKAILFGDIKTADNILKEENPSEQQRLGRAVLGYESKTWDQHKLGVVWTANYLKFTQHEDLKERLLETNNKILAESSPHDLIWGIGLSSDDNRILNPDNWTGKNLLGEILMSIRSIIKLNTLGQITR